MSRKKVIVRRFLPGLISGYLSPHSFLSPDHQSLELLDLSGRLIAVPLAEIKFACFVRDFNTADALAPERLGRKTFQGRPRTEGLWLRLSLRDEDVLEGLAPLDRGLADGMVEDGGFHLIPPDIRGNTQRLYVPVAAVAQMDVVGVVRAPSRRKVSAVQTAAERQPDLFDLAIPPNSRPQ